MQSCSTPEPHCSPAGPTFLQRKGHFHCSQQKVPACKPAHRLARAPWRLHSVHRRISHCPQQSLTGREAPGQHLSPEELPLLTELFHRCAQPACEEPRAAGHAPCHRQEPGDAGKSPHKQQPPQDREAGKGGSSLPGNLCSHLHLCSSRRAR